MSTKIIPGEVVESEIVPAPVSVAEEVPEVPVQLDAVATPIFDAMMREQYRGYDAVVPE